MRVKTFAVAIIATLALAGCLAKEKHQDAKRFSPPWDQGQEPLHQLEGYVKDGPDSLFEVFEEMARIDSGAGPRQGWTYEPGSPDTLRVHHLVDTSFSFPEKPLDTYAFAYDETYRDDTLFRKAYGNGLFIEEHPCADVWVVSDPFMHPVRWLTKGMTQDEILNNMGPPSLKHKGALRYLYRDQPEIDGLASPDGEAPPLSEFQRVEGAHFYFNETGLFAAVFQRSRPCH
jgi:hypothetical protein